MDESLILLKLLIEGFVVNVETWLKAKELEVIDLTEGSRILQVLARVASNLLMLMQAGVAET